MFVFVLCKPKVQQGRKPANQNYEGATGDGDCVGEYPVRKQVLRAPQDRRPES